MRESTPMPGTCIVTRFLPLSSLASCLFHSSSEEILWWRLGLWAVVGFGLLAFVGLSLSFSLPSDCVFPSFSQQGRHCFAKAGLDSCFRYSNPQQVLFFVLAVVELEGLVEIAL